MISRLFNSCFENSMRILLLLSVAEKPLDLDLVVCLDLFATNGKAYGFLSENLHGDGLNPKASIGHRRKAYKKALAELVGRGFVDVKKKKNGVTYTINLIGEGESNSIDCDYASKYKNNVITVIRLLSHKTRGEILRLAGYDGRL